MESSLASDRKTISLISLKWNRLCFSIFLYKWKLCKTWSKRDRKRTKKGSMLCLLPVYNSQQLHTRRLNELWLFSCILSAGCGVVACSRRYAVSLQEKQNKKPEIRFCCCVLPSKKPGLDFVCTLCTKQIIDYSGHIHILCEAFYHTNYNFFFSKSRPSWIFFSSRSHHGIGREERW